jgi:hypothetical protein
MGGNFISVSANNMLSLIHASFTHIKGVQNSTKSAAFICIKICQRVKAYSETAQIITKQRSYVNQEK